MKKLFSGHFEEKKAVENCIVHLQKLAETKPEEAVQFLDYLRAKQNNALIKISKFNFNLSAFEKKGYWAIFQKMAEIGCFKDRWNSYKVLDAKTKKYEKKDLVEGLLDGAMSFKDNTETANIFIQLLKYAFNQNAEVSKSVRENKYIYLSRIQHLPELVDLLERNGLGNGISREHKRYQSTIEEKTTKISS